MDLSLALRMLGPGFVISLGDALPIAQERVRRLLEVGLEIGPPGVFYCMVCRAALAQAERAVMSGDLTQMIAAYQELEDIKD